MKGLSATTSKRGLQRLSPCGCLTPEPDGAGVAVLVKHGVVLSGGVDGVVQHPAGAEDHDGDEVDLQVVGGDAHLVEDAGAD